MRDSKRGQKRRRASGIITETRMTKNIRGRANTGNTTSSALGKRGRQYNKTVEREMKRDELLTKAAMEIERWPDEHTPIMHGLPYLGPGIFWGVRGCEWCIREPHVITRDEYLAERERLVNKPSWEGAPDWATHLIQDPIGTWFWLKDFIRILEKLEGWESGLSEPACDGAIVAGHRWQDTLESRPEQSDEDDASWHAFDDEPPSKYHVKLNGQWIDVYDVLHVFGVTNAGDQHAIKKMLRPGQRGHKDAIQDRREAIESLERAIALEGGQS